MDGRNVYLRLESDGRTHRRCVRCRAAAAKRHRAALPPEKRAASLAYFKSINAKRNAAYALKRRLSYATNAELVKRSVREWNARNPEVIATQSSRKRARKAGAPGAHGVRAWRALLASYHGLCVYCGRPAETRDHVSPLSVGGSNDIENIVPACRSCNSSKRGSALLIWLARRAQTTHVDIQEESSEAA